MTADHDTYDTLAAVYALGALDGQDRVEFEAHLRAGCERCDAALRASEETLAKLAGAAPPVPPPASVRAALIERLHATAPIADRRTWRARWLTWTGIAAAAAAAVAMVTAGFVAARYEARLGQMAREIAVTRERLQAERTALRVEVAAYTSMVDLLRDPATRVVALRGLPPAPAAAGRVVWHEARGGQLVVTRLPPPPEGKAYELWTIAKGTPRPAGVFRPDASGSAVHRVEPAPGGAPVEVFAVTLEPAAGVPAPTGPMVLASGGR